MIIDVLPAGMSLHHAHMPGAHGSQRDIRFPGTGVTEVVSYVGAGNQTHVF